MRLFFLRACKNNFLPSCAKRLRSSIDNCFVSALVVVDLDESNSLRREHGKLFGGGGGGAICFVILLLVVDDGALLVVFLSCVVDGFFKKSMFNVPFGILVSGADGGGEGCVDGGGE